MYDWIALTLWAFFVWVVSGKFAQDFRAGQPDAVRFGRERGFVFMFLFIFLHSGLLANLCTLAIIFLLTLF